MLKNQLSCLEDEVRLPVSTEEMKRLERRYSKGCHRLEGSFGDPESTLKGMGVRKRCS